MYSPCIKLKDRSSVHVLVHVPGELVTIRTGIRKHLHIKLGKDVCSLQVLFKLEAEQ